MAHILIGFAEALPAPEVFFSLYDAGHQVSVFTRQGCQAPLLRHLPLVQVCYLPAPEQDAPGAVAALRQMVEGAQAPDLILPLDDAGLWLVNEAVSDPARIAGATGDAAVVALDKTRQVAAAQAAGLALPETVVLREEGDFDQITRVPAIVKPALAISVRDGRIAKDKVDYLSEVADIAPLRAAFQPGEDPRLVQPLVAGVGEGVFGFVAGDGTISHWSGHRRLRMMNPHGSGSSACVALDPDADLRARCTAFLHSIHWRGPFMIELLRDAEGTPWFMELNGRMWGSMALARGQGLEYPAWAVELAQDPGFVPPAVDLPAPPLQARHLGRDLLHLLFVLRGPKTDFYRPGWPRFTDSLRAVLSPGRRCRAYNYHPDFPGFSRREAWATLKGQFTR